ncbi:MAG: tRNA (guanosine(46)-N7)-methyltransferase TrmB [Pseudomonadales bacterium]
MEENNEPKRRAIRSFVLRGGRMTPGQLKAFDKHWQQQGLNIGDGTFDPLAVFGREAPLVLEIGYGMGESLIAMAECEVEKDFIGIEVHKPGVGRLMLLANEGGLDNLRTYNTDAIDVLNQCIADNSLHRVQLYFPDPWHKKKHNKRRIVQPEFVELVRRKLQPGGLFHMATDWENYAEQMLGVMSAAPGYKNQADGFAERPEWRPVTKFQNRGEKLGHGVWDLLFERID